MCSCVFRHRYCIAVAIDMGIIYMTMPIYIGIIYVLRCL